MTEQEGAMLRGLRAREIIQYLGVPMEAARDCAPRTDAREAGPRTDRPVPRRG